MFIILIHYKKSLEHIDHYLAAHRAYLDTGYKQNVLITSGPRNPRVGGVLLSQLTNKAQLESYLQHDPFYVNKLAEYEIIEFSPVKFHENFSSFVGNEA